MKRVLSELREFTSLHGKLSFFLFQGLLLIVLIYANYTFGVEKWADSHQYTILDFWYHFILYLVPYYLTLLAYCYWVEGSFKRLNVKAHLVVFFALAVLAFNEYFYFHKPFIQENFNLHVAYLIIICANNVVSFLTYCLPIFIFWWFWQKDSQPFYGFSGKHFNPKLYFILLLVMVPIVAIASFDASFTDYYPRFKDYGTTEYFGLPHWLGAVVFEVCYGIDFVSTEIYFRGFLILGLMRFLGPSAVFSMVTVYCVIHFGKPLGECVGSIFGGYILGVITWYTRSIYGGVIIHLGIAWLMELFAFLHNI